MSSATPSSWTESPIPVKKEHVPPQPNSATSLEKIESIQTLKTEKPDIAERTANAAAKTTDTAAEAAKCFNAKKESDTDKKKRETEENEYLQLERQLNEARKASGLLNSTPETIAPESEPSDTDPELESDRKSEASGSESEKKSVQSNSRTNSIISFSQPMSEEKEKEEEEEEEAIAIATEITTKSSEQPRLKSQPKLRKTTPPLHLTQQHSVNRLHFSKSANAFFNRDRNTTSHQQITEKRENTPSPPSVKKSWGSPSTPEKSNKEPSNNSKDPRISEFKMSIENSISKTTISETLLTILNETIISSKEDKTKRDKKMIKIRDNLGKPEKIEKFSKLRETTLYRILFSSEYKDYILIKSSEFKSENLDQECINLYTEILKLDHNFIFDCKNITLSPNASQSSSYSLR